VTLDVDIRARAGDFTLDASFSVAAGEVLAILGPNGAGKSTTLRCVAGLHTPSAGTISCGGVVFDGPGFHLPVEDRGVGFVFSDALLFPHLTVDENVAFGLRATGTGAATARSRARRRLADLGAADLGGRLPSTLSAGERQRVALARALASDPAVVLLDEPLSAVDVEARDALRPDLREALAGLDVPVALVSHDPVDAAVLADRVVVLEGGVVTHEGDLAAVAGRPRTPWAAALVGTNLVAGEGLGADIAVPGGTIHVADPAHGPVFARIDPSAVTLHLAPPEGSARNVWQGRVRTLQPSGSRIRVGVAGDVPLVAEVTPESVAAMRLVEGTEVWLSVKATEISTYPR
jgi:molybdate transport system ATP-binding protein